MSIQARKNENVGDWRMTQKILKNKFVSENTTTVAITIFFKDRVAFTKSGTKLRIRNNTHQGI